MVLASHKIDAQLAFDIDIKFLDAYGQLPVARDVVMSSLENRESSFLALLLSRPAWKTYDQSHEIFTEMLATAIANKGEEKEIDQLFQIAGSSLGPDQHLDQGGPFQWHHQFQGLQRLRGAGPQPNA